MRIIIYLSIYLLSSFGLKAQETLALSLDQVISQCKSSSLTIQKQNLEVALIQAEYQQAKEWWLPEIFLGTRVHNLDGSGLNTDGRIFSDVDRQSRWYGGELNVDWDLAEGILGTKAKKLKAQGVALRNSALQNEQLIYAIEAYYQLLLAKTQETVYTELIASKADLIDQLTVQVEAGLRLESELLLAKSNVQRLSYESMQAEQQYLESAALLLGFLNKPNVQSLSLELNDLQLIELVNIDELNKLSTENHPLLEGSALMLEAANKEGEAVKKSLLIPEAGLRYDYGPFGFDYSDNQLTRGLQAYLGWNIPLGQLIYNGQGKVADIQRKLKVMDLQEETLVINQTVNKFSKQLSKIKSILGANNGQENFAEQAMEQALTRQEAGIGSTFEVLQAQEEYIQAKLINARLIIDHNLLQYKILVALGKGL